MNIPYKALLLSVGFLGASIVSASTASVSLTNETVQGDFNLNMGAFGVDTGVTYDDDVNGAAGYVGLNVQDSEGGSGPLEAGLGVRLYLIDADDGLDEDRISSALSLGGWYRYTIPEANRLSIYGSLHYAPEVLSFSNLDHMYHYEMRFEYMTMRNARAYLRYGNTVIVYDESSRQEINKGFAVGVTVDF